METQDDASGSPGACARAMPFPFRALHEVNERCIELLVHAARNDRREPLPLVRQIGDVLRRAGPELRHRAAQRGFLLVDIEFQDAEWWQAVQREPARRLRPAGWQQAFPRRTAVPLARATLMMAWHSLQGDIQAPSVLLGMTREVATIVSGLPLSQIDRIADRRFRHVRPRWLDRPDFWRELFRSAESGSPSAMRDCSLHGLQLMAGGLLHKVRRPSD